MQSEVMVTRWRNGTTETRPDILAIEEPLEIRINGEPFSITMRTPGDDFALCAGFLFAEGIIRSRQDIRFMGYGNEKDDPDWQNVVDVRLETDHLLVARRQTPITAACGVCGKANLDAVRKLPAPLKDTDFSVSHETLLTLPSVMRAAQNAFDRTGGIHAAGLFRADGTLFRLCEDIGRHNGVDKVIGSEIMAGNLPLDAAILLVSGRAGFEILQKAAVARIPVLCAISAPSSLAVQIARDLKLTLIGFLRDDHMNIYTGEQRLRP